MGMFFMKLKWFFKKRKQEKQGYDYFITFADEEDE